MMPLQQIWSLQPNPHRDGLGAIVAAAEALGAETLFSEDLNHGQRYGPVQVRNPFLP